MSQRFVGDEYPTRLIAAAPSSGVKACGSVVDAHIASVKIAIPGTAKVSSL